jgi:hypothetical protein
LDNHYISILKIAGSRQVIRQMFPDWINGRTGDFYGSFRQVADQRHFTYGEQY